MFKKGQLAEVKLAKINSNSSATILNSKGQVTIC